MNYDKYKIADLIEKNYVFASVLYYFGIEFYDYSEETLEQVCRNKGLRVDYVIKNLESVSTQEDVPNLISFPVEIIIEYLKHTHYLFIKKRLPYIAKLVNNLTSKDAVASPVVEDLKIIFPLYVEDFIKHIYNEEDTLFTYILNLHKALNGKFHPGKLYYLMEEHSVESFAIEHDAHDDEMRGIRNLTNNYAIKEDTSLLVKVLYKELQAFEQNLIIHAKIENEVLFPKALILEKDVKNCWRKIINLN